jgi:hypothetical protein
VSRGRENHIVKRFEGKWTDEGIRQETGLGYNEPLRVKEASMSVFQKSFQKSDPNDPIFKTIFITITNRPRRWPSVIDTSQKAPPVQPPSELKEADTKDQATLDLKKFLQDAKKLKVPVNIQGKEAYEDRTSQGVDDSFLLKPKK